MNSTAWASSPSSAGEKQHSRRANYSPENGPYKLKVLDDIMLEDDHRVKHVPVTVTFPDADGVFPVIIFSHGAGGATSSYATLINYWASYGYICIQPLHADSLPLRLKTGQEANFATIIRQANTDWQGWRDRAADISLVIDRLTEISQRSPALQRKMNLQKVAVAGHSYGAFTALLVGGATIDIPRGGPSVSLADPRVQAVLMLSPQGRSKNTLGFKDEQAFSQCRQPEMIMTGSLDTGMLGQPPSWRTEPFQFAPAGNKYLVFIQGASHMSFTGQPGAEQQPFLLAPGKQDANAANPSHPGWLKRSGYGGPPPSNIQHKTKSPKVETEPVFDYVKMPSLAFWDAYLKDSSSALSYLQSDALFKNSNGKATIESK